MIPLQVGTGVDVLGILTAIAAVIVALVVLLCLLTLGVGLRKRWVDRARTSTRRSVRGELFERRRKADPEWGRWIDALDDDQREALETVIDRYLRTVSGSERDFYVMLAGHLDLGEQAAAALKSDAVLPRQRALARLTVLDYEVSPTHLLETCVDDQRVRETAARFLYERREEYDRAQALGTAFLVWDGSEPLTARGLQTLYEFNDGNPIPLLSQARWSGTEWRTTVLTQVCDVLEQCQTTARPEWFEWLLPLFDAEEPRIRAAAIRAFKQTGWREELRADIPFRDLVGDPDPRVRRATYRVLTYWGDDRAQELLEWAVIDESDARAQLVAVRGLVSLEADPMGDHPAWPAQSWDWIRAEIETTERQRLPRQTGGVVA